jgi:hypothetical protein
MADKKISELTVYTSLEDDDVIPIVDTSATETKKTLWSNIKSVLKIYFDTLYASKTVLEKTSGVIDGNNNEFGFASKPISIVADHAIYRENNGWTWNSGALIATIAFAPNDDIYGLNF